MINSNIEWCQNTWNPWKGCHKISPGCKNCYMYTDQNRFGGDPYLVVKCKNATFYAPIKLWKEPALIFTCSWSDWFIEEADKWREEAWKIIQNTPHHTYQILTKREYRILDNLPDGGLPENVWLGVSVEDKKHGLPRIDILRNIPASVRFLSIEPLLEDLGKINLTGIDWVIIGGESGQTKEVRRMHVDWARSIRDQCIEAGVAIFFKQWGQYDQNGVYHQSKHFDGYDLLDGTPWKQYPSIQ